MTRLRRTAAFAALLLAIPAVTGCAPGRGGDGGTLVVYTNSNSDGRGEWITERATAAGFDIEIVGLGGADLANRVVAEQNNPVGDVVFGLNTMYFEQFVDAGVLEPYEPSWSAGIPESAASGSGAYWPLVEQAIVTVYDENAGLDVPDSVEELWTDPAYAGRYEVQTALGQATPQLVLVGMLMPHLDGDGDFGVDDEGWAGVEAYFANGSPSVEGTDLYARFTRGEVDFGVLPSSGIRARDAEYGTSTGLVPAPEGVPFVTEQIGVIAGRGDTARSTAFIDWFGSADVQGAFAAEFGAMPVHEDAIPAADPAVVAMMSTIERQNIDYAVATQHLGDWVARAVLNYVAG